MLDFVPQLQALDRATLDDLLRAVLPRGAVARGAWQVETLSQRATAPMSGGLFRIEGSADLQGAPIPWSLILKVTRPWPDRTLETFPEGWDPSHHLPS